MRNRDDVTASVLSEHSWSTSLAAPNWSACHLLIYWPSVQINHSHFTNRIWRNGHPSRMARFVLTDTHPRVRVSTALSWGTSRRVVLITARALWGQGEVSWLRRSTAGTHVFQARDYSTGVRKPLCTLSAELRNLLCVPLLSWWWERGSMHATILFISTYILHWCFTFTFKKKSHGLWKQPWLRNTIQTSTQDKRMTKYDTNYDYLCSVWWHTSIILSLGDWGRDCLG